MKETTVLTLTMILAVSMLFLLVACGNDYVEQEAVPTLAPALTLEATPTPEPEPELELELELEPELESEPEQEQEIIEHSFKTITFEVDSSFDVSEAGDGVRIQNLSQGISIFIQHLDTSDMGDLREFFPELLIGVTINRFEPHSYSDTIIIDVNEFQIRKATFVAEISGNFVKGNIAFLYDEGYDAYMITLTSRYDTGTYYVDVFMQILDSVTFVS